MKFTMFREGGPEAPVSMRRVLAAFFALAAVGLFTLGGVKNYMTAFYGGAASLAAVVLLLFFTTWADIAAAVAAVKARP